jgi:hypothetical protein
MAKPSVVQSRLDPDLKRRATKVLLDQGITWQRWIEQQVIALVQKANRVQKRQRSPTQGGDKHQSAKEP